MRGTDKQQVRMLSLVTPDRRVPADHPLRRIKALADQALAALSPTFDEGVTLGADAAYDVASFVAAVRERGITPHVARTRDTRRRSVLDGRTTRHTGYEVSQRIRKKVEEIFGWAKVFGGLRKSRFRGKARTQYAVHLVAAAYNLLRMAKLLAAPA